MTALAFVAGVVVLANAAPAKAALSVKYSTAAVFTAGNLTAGSRTSSGTVLSGLDSTTLTFVGVTNVSVNAPTNASFGTIKATVTGAGATFTNVQFKLTITQTVPTPGGSVAFQDTLTGTISGNGSDLDLTFNPPLTQGVPFPGGSVTYTVPIDLPLVPPETNNGITSIQGKIGICPAVVTPEPGALALAFTGIPMLGFAAWRRTRKNAI